MSVKMGKTWDPGVWRHQYDGYVDPGTTNLEPSLTVQAPAVDADINVLVQRFGIGRGVMPPVPADPRYYGDFSDVPDLATALSRVRDAQERFNALDVRVRNRFHNDPVLFLDWVTKSGNFDEAVSLGLLDVKVVQPSVVPGMPPNGGISSQVDSGKA